MINLAAKTSWGDLTLTLHGNALRTCTLPPAQDSAFEYIGLTDSHPLAQEIDEFLHAFFNGKPSCFKGKLEPHGTRFQQQIWQALQTIPCGQTRTYGQIAAQIGNPKAARAVGRACGANPLLLFIPCHRVVGRSNALTGFSAGIKWKEMLLSIEGYKGERR